MTATSVKGLLPSSIPHRKKKCRHDLPYWYTAAEVGAAANRRQARRRCSVMAETDFLATCAFYNEGKKTQVRDYRSPLSNQLDRKG